MDENMMSPLRNGLHFWAAPLHVDVPKFATDLDSQTTFLRVPGGHQFEHKFGFQNVKHPVYPSHFFKGYWVSWFL